MVTTLETLDPTWRAIYDRVWARYDRLEKPSPKHQMLILAIFYYGSGGISQYPKSMRYIGTFHKAQIECVCMLIRFIYITINTDDCVMLLDEAIAFALRICDVIVSKDIIAGKFWSLWS
jgi:hypothetical protein